MSLRRCRPGLLLVAAVAAGCFGGSEAEPTTVAAPPAARAPARPFAELRLVAGPELDYVDPALASSVFITTLTDVFGFFSFLGLATIFMRFLTP